MARVSTIRCAGVLAAAALATLGTPATASSHREAPFVTEHPKVDGTDFYLFRSYESGREGYVTLLANYNPLQDAYGGPNYFSLDPSARYRIHIDNTGDSTEDLTFEFRFLNINRNISLPIGGQNVAIPLLTAGPLLVQPGGLDLRNQAELYTVELIRGDVRTPSSRASVQNAATGGTLFAKPLDNFGRKIFPDYDAYAALYMTTVTIPGCSGSGRLFVGQRREGFAVNLGEAFDLINLNPLGDPNGAASATEYKNITTLALEVPTGCLTEGSATVIGGWTTAHLPRVRELNPNPTYEQPETGSSDFVQVSRLGMPLVNEVVIGLKDKNLFNASHPRDDLQFATYVTNPFLPELIELLFPVSAPNSFPRNDLLFTFVTGISGVNQFGFGEMQRLNTTIAPTPRASQNTLGVIGGDNAGFPNGRRPGDDTVDIALRVVMGVLCQLNIGCTPADAPSGALPYTDGAGQSALDFTNTFPYLASPLPGSPNSLNGIGN